MATLVIAALASGCTVDVGIGDSEGAVIDDIGAVGPDGQIDYCYIRHAGLDEPVPQEICYDGDLTNGRVRASGLQPGSDLVVRDSTGQEVVLAATDETVSTVEGSLIDVELGFPQGSSEIRFAGTWSDGEQVDFVVSG